GDIPPSGEIPQRLARNYKGHCEQIASHAQEMTEAPDTRETFHLLIVDGTQPKGCDVLRAVREHLPEAYFREIRLKPADLNRDFDFLRSYRDSPTEILFDFSSPSEIPAPVRIIADLTENGNGGALRLGLMREPHTELQMSVGLQSGRRGP